MQPKIKQSIIERLSKASNNIEKAAEREENKMLPIAIKLLNTFQKKIKTKVEFVNCNGDFWLVDSDHKFKRYIELCKALDAVANPISPGSFYSRSNPFLQSYQEAIMRRFPELVELWWIAYKLDAMPCRPELPSFKPTVKPRKFK